MIKCEQKTWKDGVGWATSAKGAAITDTTNTTNRLTLAVAVVIMLILSIPLYLITRRLGSGVV